ncbi:hypothetical protein ASG49_16105 [Marmoricola sp. Leaf446]|uniref:RNA polymerase sigma factor n=1 Tax=Nocardioides aurantiacus TaxID=86796 RepID=A0A3N2CVB8_9ACTN|nr:MULTISPECIES: sigma-70 family RNA polymerase sigma factor [Nocardioidaceae]KQT89305.1 hypothetical protein ASG49_16105 [Marmoricola sp. Leaf446]ROR91490.1 RNA polymerase sigma-70 factor (ECF subfamily) [Nocardioides aurantiacus]
MTGSGLRGSAVVDLATALRDGRHDALEELFDRWSPLVHSLAWQALRDPHEADEVTQLVFVSAWRSRETLRPSDTALPAWLVGICRHRIADRFADRSRESRRLARMASEEDVLEADRVEVLGTEQFLEALTMEEALGALPEPRQTVVRLAFLEDQTHAEISRRLGLPLGTVKSHVRRGLLQLRDRLAVSHDDAPR